VLEKYLELLDRQTIEFIERVNHCYPDNAIELTMTEQRSLYNAMCHEFAAPVSASVTWVDQQLDGADRVSVNVRHYSPASEEGLVEANRPAIVYLHGGGFVVGGLDSHHDVCAELSLLTDCHLWSVDYRLAPEHPHPAALDDALTVVNWLAARNIPIVLCGDSAGASLAASVSALLKRDPQENEKVQAVCSAELLGQVLIYPGMGGELLTDLAVQDSKRFGDLTVAPPAYREHAHAPMLTAADVDFYHDIRIGPNQALSAERLRHSVIALEGDAQWVPVDHRRSLVPLLDESFAGLPYTVCFGAECDPLHDDGRYYCHAISQARGAARFVSEQGLVHGYLRARHSVERASASFDRIVSALQSCLALPVPERLSPIANRE